MIWLIVLLSSLLVPSFGTEKVKPANSLRGKVICLDPGHGGTAQTDHFRKGLTGEREEWINLRVALQLAEMLEKKGAKVLLTRYDDSNIAFDDRIKLALDNKADVFLSIHHNATADSAVNFPIVYFHGNASENQASVSLGKEVARQLNKALFKNASPVSLVSDHTIFPTAGTKVLRGTYGIPGVIAEASFFTNLQEEQRLKSSSHNRREAEAFTKALEEFFRRPVPTIAPKNSLVQVAPFPVFQEAERMNAEARQWHADFLKGEKLLQKGDTAAIQTAYDLFSRSARSFPDSYVAGKCHQYRAVILERMGKREEAGLEKVRIKEFYPQVPVSTESRP